MAQARCPSFPLPFQSEFLSQLPLNCLFVPMLLLGSIHQNVFTCPKHAMLKQINFYGFSSRSAIFKHPNKKGFNFPSSQYLLLPLSLGTLWMRRGHCNENISIRCPLSLWKCPSQCVALWAWWKFLSDKLVILLAWSTYLILFPLVLCAFLPDWQHHVTNTQKHITDFLGPVTHPLIWNLGHLFYALLHILCMLLLYSVLSDQRYFSPMPPSKWVYLKILSS